MASGSPLARMKEQFGGKDKLVDKLVGLVDAGDESKDDLRRRLLGAANKKLLRLFGVATKVKEHGGHDKLAAVAAEGVGHGKDKDYVAKLGSYSNGRLVDMVVVAERHAKRKTAAPAKTAAKSAAVKAAAIAAKAPKAKVAKVAAKAPAKGGKPKSKSKSGKSK
jgi:hypothetical protein